MQYQATYYTNLSAKSYHPFGMQMPGRHKPAQSGEEYRFGFNGMEKDGEAWTGSAGNQLNFGARIYDSRLGRFLSVDELQSNFANISNYIFAGDNPIYYIDYNGNFKIALSELARQEYGMTEVDLVRYEKVLTNVKEFLINTPNALRFVAAETGLSEEQILKDFTFGEGPTVLVDFRPLISGGAQVTKNDAINEQIGVDGLYLKYFNELDMESEEFKEQAFLKSVTLIHEYTHYGDRITNDGMITGQDDCNGDPDCTSNAGKQKIGVSASGHRGTDVENSIFDIESSANSENGKETIDKVINKNVMDNPLNNDAQEIILK